MTTAARLLMMAGLSINSNSLQMTLLNNNTANLTDSRWGYYKDQ